MVFVAYFMALFVGIILGILGSGGSILTVPILVYLIGIKPVSATAYSLFIVGVTALVGAQRFFRNGQINYKISLYFAFPSLLGVFVSRKWILPNLSESLHFFHFFSIKKDTFILVFLGIVMLIAALSMLLSWKINSVDKNNIENNLILIAFDGIVVGLITGFVGAGGGFLIIPALLLLTNISMNEAIGTSLLIIAIKSILGFTAELNNIIEWNLLFTFTVFSISGILIGSYFSKLLNGGILKKSFGIFVLLISIVILTKEIFF
ncbi:MAG: permease [Flavobacteriales bacterium]|nr:permease [Flavobacteriales bacterium]|tara:strand:- start:5170 stop:5958 length:789 start_codon:yes stop_codon:yes gene_type:complete